MRTTMLVALLALGACNPPERTASDVRMDQRFARLGSARLLGEVTGESPVGEILVFGSSEEDGDTRSFTLKDTTGNVRITYFTANADGPLADGERVGADIDLIIPVQLGAVSIDQESVAVARKVWHAPEEASP
jgi:hypothetical protein